MGQQMADRDLILESTGKIGEVARDRGIKVDLALIVEHHDRGRGANDFRQRREIVDARVDGDRRLAGPVERAKASREDGIAFSPDHDRGSWVPTGIEAALHHALNRRQTRRRHTNSGGLPNGKSGWYGVTEGEERGEQEHGDPVKSYMSEGVPAGGSLIGDTCI